MLSPILSGGCVVACSGFDAVLFWDILHLHNTARMHDGQLAMFPQSSSSYQALSQYDNQESSDVVAVKASNTNLLPPITWYYAAPSMHHSILQHAAALVTPSASMTANSVVVGDGATETGTVGVCAEQLPVASVRFIANAAGGLLPVLANALRDTFFNATILTGYGMTEW